MLAIAPATQVGWMCVTIVPVRAVARLDLAGEVAGVRRRWRTRRPPPGPRCPGRRFRWSSPPQPSRPAEDMNVRHPCSSPRLRTSGRSASAATPSLGRSTKTSGADVLAYATVPPAAVTCGFDRLRSRGVHGTTRLPELGAQRTGLLEGRGDRATAQPLDLRVRLLHGGLGGGHVHVEPDRDTQDLRRRPNPHGFDQRSVGLSLEHRQRRLSCGEGLVEQLDRSGGAVRASIRAAGPRRSAGRGTCRPTCPARP